MARGVKRLLKILLVLILLGAIAYVSIVLMVCWKETHVAAPGKDYEAMLVLGAQVKPDGTPSLQLQWRLEKAAETYRQKKVPVVVCGGQGGNEPAPEAVVMRDVLIGLGVDEDMILMDTTSASTHSNIKNAMQLLEGRNVTKVMVITSDYSGFMLFFFASGKCAKIPLNSYATKLNRRKLLKAYSDKETLAKMVFLPEETELAIRTSAGRMLLVGTAQISAKATRDSQGVAVVTLKKNQHIASVVPAETLELANPHRYRVRSLPATGALIRAEDEGEQLTLL